jgi:hypothetical protein
MAKDVTVTSQAVHEHGNFAGRQPTPCDIVDRHQRQVSHIARTALHERHQRVREVLDRLPRRIETVDRYVPRTVDLDSVAFTQNRPATLRLVAVEGDLTGAPIAGVLAFHGSNLARR